MFCSNCGNKLPDNANFCDNCGNQTTRSNTPSQNEKPIYDLPSSPGNHQQNGAPSFNFKINTNQGPVRTTPPIAGCFLGYLMPGLGHFYMKYYARGAFYLILSIALWIAFITIANTYGSENYDTALYRIGILIAIFGVWFISPCDAYYKAWNAEHKRL